MPDDQNDLHKLRITTTGKPPTVTPVETMGFLCRDIEALSLRQHRDQETIAYLTRQLARADAELESLRKVRDAAIEVCRGDREDIAFGRAQAVDVLIAAWSSTFHSSGTLDRPPSFHENKELYCPDKPKHLNFSAE
jgi:hypothetical protein